MLVSQDETLVALCYPIWQVSSRTVIRRALRARTEVVRPEEQS